MDAVGTTEEMIRVIEAGAASAMSDEQIIQQEIGEWLLSPERQAMLEGERYYKNKGDITRRNRETIGEDGKLVEAKNLANNKLVHGFLRKLVDQKAGYLLSKEMSIQTKDTTYNELLTDIFDKGFRRLLKSLLKESIKKGKGWLHIYYDEKGNFRFKKLPSEEIIPLWRDKAHTELDALIRIYKVEVYQGITKTIVQKVEFWHSGGVNRYESGQGNFSADTNNLIPDVELGETAPHIMSRGNENKGFNWDRLPFVCFKYNEDELPLISLLKSQIDEYDRKKSDNSNNLEDLPESIYVIRGYDDEDLGTFRKNLTTFRAVKVSAEDNAGVDTLNLEINTEAYKNHMQMTRKDIYEFGRGVDTQSDSFATAPSGEALKFLYADLDMDANDIENEFQAALEQLMWFVNTHISNTTRTDYSNETVNFIFNRDIVINESQVITDAKNSEGIISKETQLANHPWVTDVKEEMKRMDAEKKDAENRIGEYGGLPANTPPESDEIGAADQ